MALKQLSHAVPGPVSSLYDLLIQPAPVRQRVLDDRLQDAEFGLEVVQRRGVGNPALLGDGSDAGLIVDSLGEQICGHLNEAFLGLFSLSARR